MSGVARNVFPLADRSFPPFSVEWERVKCSEFDWLAPLFPQFPRFPAVDKGLYAREREEQDRKSPTDSVPRAREGERGRELREQGERRGQPCEIIKEVTT